MWTLSQLVRMICCSSVMKIHTLTWSTDVRHNPLLGKARAIPIASVRIRLLIDQAKALANTRVGAFKVHIFTEMDLIVSLINIC